MKLFTTEQFRIIKRHWNGENHEELAKLLDIPAGVVQDRLSKLPKYYLTISLEYQELMKTNKNAGTTRVYAGGKKYDLQADTNRTWWSPEDEQYLVDNYYTETLDNLCDYLNREPRAVTGKARQLGLYIHNKPAQTKEQWQRPPAVYSNRNLREELLDKYAPIQ